MYVTIQGQEDINVYSLDTTEGNHTSGRDKLKTGMLLIIAGVIVAIIRYIHR